MSNEFLASDVYAEKELVEDKNVVYPDCKWNRPTLSIQKKKKVISRHLLRSYLIILWNLME